MTTPDLALDSSPDITIRRDLWLTRLYYFAFFGSLGFVAPFLNLYFVKIGLNGTEIGWIGAVGSTVALVASPIWTSLAVQWNRPKRLLQVALGLLSLCYFWLAVPATFVIILINTAARGLTGAGIPPLQDSLALTITRRANTGFGSIRIWGSMGWIVMVLGAGWLVERTGLLTSLVGAGVATAACLVAASLIPAGSFSATRTTDQRAAPSGALIRNLINNRAMFGVALMLIIIGLANAGVNQFETVYLQSLGASDSLIGFAGMLAAVFEIPVMPWADKLVGRKGTFPLLLLSLLLFVGVRLLVLLFPSVLSIMIARTLTGACYGFFLVALMRVIADETQPTETGTVLALYTVTIGNLVNIVGAPISGLAYDHIGVRWLYLVGAIGFFLGWAILYWARPKKSTGSTSVPPQPDSSIHEAG